MNRIFVISAFVLVGLICDQAYGMMEEDQKPWQYRIKLYHENGMIIQKENANNPVWLQGIKGRGIQIAFLEPGDVDQKHSQFSKEQIKIKEYQEPWQYRIKLCHEDGTVIQKQIANNPIWLHGFNQLHEQGIKGRGIQIAFLEPGGVDQKHSQFSEEQIKIIDCSQLEHSLGEDLAIVRHNNELNLNRLYLSYFNFDDHGSHVMGVALGQKKLIEYVCEGNFLLNNPQTGELDYGHKLFEFTRYIGNHPGGCCPEAKGILYAYSVYTHRNINPCNCVGTSIFSIQKLKDLNRLYYSYIDREGKEITIEEYYTNIQPPLTEREKRFMIEFPVDGSSIKAFEEALIGPAFAINWSTTPFFLMDPLEYKIPTNILDKFGYLAEKNDKIIIFCANNYGECLEDRRELEFYKQILMHPILSKRTLFAVNVCPTNQEDKNKIGEISINNYKISFKLFPSSNYPGYLFSSLCLSAVGSNIISGYNNNKYLRGSGTSESAPIITSIAALVKQKFPKMSGPEVIQKLKNTALPLGDSKFTGLGYVWAPGALEIIENNN